ncbi:hypothetical protein AB0478_47865, partial [Streptomyces sp. NPDC051917]|uniref:hypothetical protein n=1 Tax=Streptomyces sp. NPDC051917 TaxID=3154754 RepID=UPI003452E680
SCAGQLAINRTGTGPNPRSTPTPQDRFDNGFSAAETTAVTEAKVETVSSPAPVPGSIVPPWREGLPVTVLTPDYQRILGVLEERQPSCQGPLKAREITVQLGLETTSAKVEGVRSKARRLAERGWLLQETSGAFSVGRRPVAVPDAGSSA